MSRIFSKSVCSLLALSAASACVSVDDVPGPPYEVVVLDRGAPGSDEFSLQRRHLTLDDFERLTAPNFRIRQAGVLRAEQIHGDMISAGSFDDDQPPALRYVVEDGVAVPRDYATLLAFSAANQFETVLAGLGDVMTPSVKAAFDARGSLDVILSPEMRFREAGTETSLRINGNAFFFAPGWQFGLAQSSDAELAPLAADARVIAHELGHATFQTAFLGDTEERCESAHAADNARDPWFVGRLESELVIGGLNEGFADWLSFAVTGGTDPMSSLDIPADPTLTETVRERVLTEDTFGWGDIVKLGLEDAPSRRCRGKYCVGTLFARSLLEAYQASGNALDDVEARHAYSRKVVAALEGTLPRLLELDVPLPSPELARCKFREEVSAELDPPLIGSFMQSFLRGLPRVDATAVCRALEARFEAGFPPIYREACEP